jgi:heptosyltransferase-1
LKVLIIKMSSLGDVVHCLPAVTDLLKSEPSAVVDWVVEEAFQEIPRFHPGVRNVIPVAIRRWRKSWFRHRNEIGEFVKKIRQEHYDLIIDAQGLFKSAVVANLAHGKVMGFDRASVREPIASLSYQGRFAVARNLHAVLRQRQLFARVFDYALSDELDYGLISEVAEPTKDLYFFHGTTWPSKHWPDSAWRELARLCCEAGYRVVLPYISQAEQARAEFIADQIESVIVVPPNSLKKLGEGVSRAAGAVSVDTGLGHLAAAFNIPLVALYGATSPELTGVTGTRQLSLASPDLECAPCMNRVCKYQPESSKIYPPCFESLSPGRVFTSLMQQMRVNE